MQPRHQATLTEPSQCILQHDVANPRVSTHIATPDDNNHAAIPMRSATTDSRNAYRTTHTGTTTRCRTLRRNRLTSKRSKPQPPHTGGTFHRRLQQLYTEKHKVSCSGFPHNTSPMQHSCNHHNAFCSMTWLTRMYLRTWQHQMTTITQPFQCDLQPQIQETHSNRRTQEVPFIACCIHLTRKNTRFRALASSATQAPCNIHAAITMRPLPFVTTSLPHHFPSSHIVTTSVRSPLPFLTTSLRHHFPSSPLPFLTTSLRRHTPFVSTSLSHHFP